MKVSKPTSIAFGGFVSESEVVGKVHSAIYSESEDQGTVRHAGE